MRDFGAKPKESEEVGGCLVETSTCCAQKSRHTPHTVLLLLVQGFKNILARLENSR
jgi:hypothetical protein